MATATHALAVSSPDRDRSAGDKTLALYRRLGRFADLIYCPLDLPAPPGIERSRLLEWVAAARSGRTIDEEHLFTKGTGDAYPWRAAYAAYNGRWCSGFDASFPALADYLGAFPTASWACIAALLQEPRRDVWLHTDPDPVLGWRLYLGHGGARTFFCPTFERRSERLSTWTAEGPRDWAKFVDTRKRIYARAPSGSGAWILNAYRAAHGVEAHRGGAGERATLVLVPEVDAIDVEGYLALLERSVEKYKDHAIWYPGAAA